MNLMIILRIKEMDELQMTVQMAMLLANKANQNTNDNNDDENYEFGREN